MAEAVGIDLIRRLTPRERIVLERLLRGASNKAIANHLTCSVKTVEFHVSNLLKKSGVTSRLELVTSVAASSGPLRAWNRTEPLRE